VAGPADLKAFIRLPHELYQEDQFWVPPLDSDVAETLSSEKNPFFQHAERELFLAEKDGKVVGRIAAIIDHSYVSHHHENSGFFGFFETTHDAEVAGALLTAARDHLRAKGMTRMLGPANPSMGDENGMLLEGYDSRPMIKMPYNPPWYLELCEQYGMVKAKDLFAYRINADQPVPPAFQRIIDGLTKMPGLVVRPINVRRLHEDLAKIKEIYNDAWTSNWDFAPMTDAEIEDMARKMKPLIVPEIIPIVEINDEPAGMSIALPDYNQVLAHMAGKLDVLKFLYYQRKIDACRLWALGIKSKFRRLGIDVLLYYHTFMGARKKGYTWGELSWILEDNVNIIRPILRWDVKLYKKYRVFQMAV
jgi:hypothetical protein